MSHFFVNLDKLLYSFKKKTLVVSILLDLKVLGTSEHTWSHVHIRLILQFVAKATRRRAKVQGWTGKVF